MGCHDIKEASEEVSMLNDDILKGKWNEIKGEVKAKWGKLTDDDLTEIAGNQEKLMGILQKRYGHAKEEVEREYRDFMNRRKKRAA
jgi:uncharacterized protein YjbJ (UPF0337 family)